MVDTATTFPDERAQPGQALAVVPSTPPDVTRFKRLFDDARDAMVDARRLAEACRDYYDGQQLTSEQRNILKMRKQPDVVINRTRRAVDGILGIVESNKTDPRAYMRNPPIPGPQTPGTPTPGQGPGMPPGPGLGLTSQPGPGAGMGGNVVPFPQAGGQPPPGAIPGMPPPPPELDASDVASMTLRYIADTSRFPVTKMDVLEGMCIEGTAAVLIQVDAKREVRIDPIQPDEYFWDARSRKADFSDKNYDGIAKWMYADDVIADYPDKARDIENSITTGDAGVAGDLMWDDKPDLFGGQSWTDKRQRRLMVVEMYYRVAGQGWWRCKFHGGGWLDEPAPSPYLSDDGAPINPIEAVSAYISRGLVRYGVVKDMMDVQDEINARRSKAIHEINTRQIQQNDPNAPPIDVDMARGEAARPDGVLPSGWVVVNRSDVVANSIAMLQEAKSELERLAPNPAILGRQGADASGRAQQLRAQAGLTEFARFLGRFNDWEMRVYKQAWGRARQFWDAPKWIRVTDDAGSPQYVQVNQLVGVNPMTGMPIFKNEVARMDVDIVLDTVPDTTTLQQEIWADLVKLAEAYGPQAVPFEIMIEMSPLPKKQALIKRLQKARADQAQGQAAALQAAAATQQAKLEETQSKTAKNLADAKKTEVEAVTTALDGHAQAHAHNAIPPSLTARAEFANLLAPLLQPPLADAQPAGPPGP